MEAAAAAVARGGGGGGGSMPTATMTQAAAQTRKQQQQWRAVSEHQHQHQHQHQQHHLPARNIGGDEERSKLGHSDERALYEQGREPVDVDFCSITIDGTMNHDLLQQRLHDIARQREELQHLETELRAQMIARSEIMEIQNNFDAQLKDHANASSKLQEQLREKEQIVHDLERKLEDQDRELHAIKLDNEAAWAKEGLLREQNKELATFRRERDHSEAERAQHLQQLHDLQEHLQEKERQLIELQEQHRLAQEAILFKDEQLNEAQAWINRVQEMDGLQSTTLQNQLREHTEHYNQLWLGCQRQFAEMERHHMHTVQQLQLELADARQRGGAYTDESRRANSSSKDASQFARNNGNQMDMNTLNGNTGAIQNGNSEEVPSFSSTGNASNQVDHVPSVPISPSSLLGIPPYLPPGQVTGMHPFLLHQPGVPQSMPPQVPQSHVGNYHSIPAMSSLQQWQNQQAPSETLQQIPAQNEPQSSQNDQNLIRSDGKYNYETSVNGQPFHQDYLDVQIRQEAEPEPVISSSPEEAQVLESINSGYLVTPQNEQSLQQISSQFHDSLRLDSLEKSNEMKAHEQTSTDHGLEGQVLTAEKPSSDTYYSKSDTPVHSVSVNETSINNSVGTGMPESFLPTGQTNGPSVGRSSETSLLLDERSLLVCMVRTIPAGGRIRISSTLPNRLGKMLAPLHWHDYKKKYGKLDDFVAAHSELFVIEGDYIQLREGAQEMIAATAAVAKVAAAAAASTPYSSYMPSVAVTPVAQTHRLKKISSLDSNPNANNAHLQSVNHIQQFNGASFGVSGGQSNVKILSKSKDLNGPESIPGQSSVLPNGGNGAPLDRSMANGRQSSNFAGKQQHGRMTNSSYPSRR